MAQYKCNLIIPGAAKSGTSSLHELLNLHPNISMSKEKEPHYFSRRDKFEMGSDYFNSIFEDGRQKKVFGESSTSYLICEEAIQRIYECLHTPRIVMVLRHPVDRTFSHYCWRYKLGLENRSFLDAIVQNGYGYNPDKTDTFGYMSYLQFSKYSTYIPIWIEAFGKDNVHLLNSRDLGRDENPELAKIHKFLGLAPTMTSNTTRMNSTESVMVRPSMRMTLAASLIPQRFKKTELYAYSKRVIAKQFTKEPPRFMTQEERGFIENELSDDIAFFNTTFAG